LPGRWGVPIIEYSSHSLLFPSPYLPFYDLEIHRKEVVELNELLKELMRDCKEYIVVEGEEKRGIRYKNGKFQILCPTCAGEKWMPVAPEYAEKFAESLLKR
jgi:hypothetical protein